MNRPVLTVHAPLIVFLALAVVHCGGDDSSSSPGNDGGTTATSGRSGGAATSGGSGGSSGAATTGAAGAAGSTTATTSSGAAGSGTGSGGGGAGGAGGGAGGFGGFPLDGSIGMCPPTKPAEGTNCPNPLSVCPYGTIVCACGGGQGWVCHDFDGGFNLDGFGRRD